MLEILLDNKNGNLWDISEIAYGLSWKTSRIGSPGRLEFSLIKRGIYQDKGFKYNNGDIVRVIKDGFNVFYGYIFSVDEGRSEEVRILCYDQMRYLLCNATYVFKNTTAADMVIKIANDFKLKLGRIDDTGYKIPAMMEDNKKLLDIICKALDYTLINAGKNYFLFDDFGALSIRKSDDMLLDFIVGDGSLMYDYSSKRSIDDDTYNRIKLYKDNKETGRREVYQAQDSANMAKWGILQLYQSVDENMNSAQINQLLNTLIAVKNRESKSLRIEAIGDIRVRAGCYIHIIIEEYGINQPFIVNECTHKFEGADHTMSLELKVI